MTTKIKVGDRALNIGYLEYIGNTQKWLQMNMDPFKTILSVGDCRPWNETVTCFSVHHHDVKELANIPMHRNKLFNVDTGFDMDRQLEQFLCVRKDKEKIKELVSASVEKNIKKGNEYSFKLIKDAELEIIKLKKKIEDHTSFCHECGDYIISECQGK